MRRAVPDKRPSAAVVDIAWTVPELRLTNTELDAAYPEWSVSRIARKTGIDTRHIAATGETASGLAVKACERLFEQGAVRREDIDFLMLCTQSPDYFLPTTACLVQERLGLRRSVGALDFNLGCSGFPYGLAMARGLIETNQARHVLLVTTDTYTKFIAPDDRSVRTLFGDGAAATLVSAVGDSPAGPQGDVPEQQHEWVGETLFGTDGRGGERLIVRGGGLREPDAPRRLFMDGAELFRFALEEVPRAVRRTLARTGETVGDIDFFVFHQANRHMLEALRQELAIEPERFVLYLEDIGNTVSASIPIALAEAVRTGALRRGHSVMLVGFGVGYSWATTRVTWYGR